MTQCDTKTGTCSNQNQENHEPCCVEASLASSNCCPVDKGLELWQKAFFSAMHEVHVDILKEKIRKAWGPQLDKSSDAVIDAMGVHWQSFMNQAKAQGELKEALKAIYFGKK